MITKYTIVIPGRIASTRMQNKLARNDTGKALMQHTIDQCRKSCAERVLFTVDSQALAACLEYGPGDMAFITTREASCGTERVAMYVGAAPHQFATITVNVQADEPMINPHDIDHLANELYANDEFEIATLVAPLHWNDLENPDVVKAFVEHNTNRCGDFSRLPRKCWKNRHGYEKFHHVGVYAFRTTLLKAWAKDYPQTDRSVNEGLEQLSWLGIGKKILAVKIDHDAPMSINTEDDYTIYCATKKDTD